MCATTGMNPKSTLLNDRSQTREFPHHMIPHTSHSTKDKTIGTETNLWLLGSECGEGTDCKGPQELCQSNKNVMYLYCFGGCTIIFICQNSSNCKLYKSEFCCM